MLAENTTNDAIQEAAEERVRMHTYQEYVEEAKEVRIRNAYGQDVSILETSERGCASLTALARVIANQLRDLRLSSSDQYRRIDHQREAGLRL